MCSYYNWNKKTLRNPILFFLKQVQQLDEVVYSENMGKLSPITIN